MLDVHIVMCVFVHYTLTTINNEETWNHDSQVILKRKHHNHGQSWKTYILVTTCAVTSTTESNVQIHNNVVSALSSHAMIQRLNHQHGSSLDQYRLFQMVNTYTTDNTPLCGWRLKPSRDITMSVVPKKHFFTIVK